MFLYIGSASGSYMECLQKGPRSKCNLCKPLLQKQEPPLKCVKFFVHEFSHALILRPFDIVHSILRQVQSATSNSLLQTLLFQKDLKGTTWTQTIGHEMVQVYPGTRLPGILTGILSDSCPSVGVCVLFLVGGGFWHVLDIHSTVS